MPIVKVIRSGEYINRFWDYGIYIDDKKVGTISNGEAIQFEVSSGEHTIYAKIDWGYSPKKRFDIAEGHYATFKVGGFKGAKWLMPIGLAFITLYYVATYVFKADGLFLIGLALPTFFVLMYFITFGRKRYLTLQQGKQPTTDQVAAANIGLVK